MTSIKGRKVGKTIFLEQSFKSNHEKLTSKLWVHYTARVWMKNCKQTWRLIDWRPLNAANKTHTHTHLNTQTHSNTHKHTHTYTNSFKHKRTSSNCVQTRSTHAHTHTLSPLSHIHTHLHYLILSLTHTHTIQLDLTKLMFLRKLVFCIVWNRCPSEFWAKQENVVKTWFLRTKVEVKK